jgi:HrpA-like RNA helicase
VVTSVPPSRSTPHGTTLPILAVLPDLLAALRDTSNAVLVAPPGAGKTTAVAPALLDQAWCSGEILLLSARPMAMPRGWIRNDRARRGLPW